MDAAQGRGDADGEAQEASHLHRRAQDPVERIASRILEQQHGPAAFAHELQRAHRLITRNRKHLPRSRPHDPKA